VRSWPTSRKTSLKVNIILTSTWLKHLLIHDIAHGADVYIDPAQLGTAAPPRAVHNKETSAATKINTGETGTAAKQPKIVNTTKLEETIEFQTSAHELYETLLDSQRVNAWTHGSAKIEREVGGKFELFNGNVSGEIVEVVSACSFG
jgi:activator of HSP90 ATPase